MIEGSDAGLRDYGDALSQQRVTRRRLAARIGLTGLGCGAVLLITVLPPPPRLVWNASPSAPIGLYAVSPGADFGTGNMVIAWPPANVRLLAESRRYLPLGVPLVKRVAAGPGDQVCASGTAITINGR